MGRPEVFRMLAAAVIGVLPLSSAAAQTLRGSRASVELMYTSARTGDLEFMRTPAAIYQGAMSGALKLVSITEDLDLERVTFPFVLPNTLRFADSLAAEYHAGCGERLVVTSGVRPIDEQPRNASPKSVHPTGMAVDFRKPRTPACLKWLRTHLVTLEDRGLIEATEERRPPHFHVAVLRQAAEPKVATVAASSEKADTEQTSHERSYRVRSGDNLSVIAQRHNTTPSRLQTLNHLRTTRIRPGQELILP